MNMTNLFVCLPDCLKGFGFVELAQQLHALRLKYIRHHITLKKNKMNFTPIKIKIRMFLPGPDPVPHKFSDPGQKGKERNE